MPNTITQANPHAKSTPEDKFCQTDLLKQENTALKTRQSHIREGSLRGHRSVPFIRLPFIWCSLCTNFRAWNKNVYPLLVTGDRNLVPIPRFQLPNYIMRIHKDWKLQYNECIIIGGSNPSIFYFCTISTGVLNRWESIIENPNQSIDANQ